MKKLLMLVLIAMSLVLIAGCSDDDNGGGGTDFSFAPEFQGTPDDSLVEPADPGEYYGLSGESYAELYTGVSQAEVTAYVALLVADGYTPKHAGTWYEKSENGKTYVVEIYFEQTNPGELILIQTVLDGSAPIVPTSIVISPAVNLGVSTAYTLTYTPAGSNASCTAWSLSGSSISFSGSVPAAGATSFTATINSIGSFAAVCGGTPIPITE